VANRFCRSLSVSGDLSAADRCEAMVGGDKDIRYVFDRRMGIEPVEQLLKTMVGVL
jgi:hypothetical protein